MTQEDENMLKVNINSFMTGGPYHKETNPFICSANQWTGFYMLGTSVMEALV